MFNFLRLMFADPATPATQDPTTPDVKWEWVGDVVNAIQSILWPILIIVGAAGMIYAVVLGVNMARADSTEKREEHKQRLINVIVSLAVIIALILLFQLFIAPDGILDQIWPNMRPD